MIPTMSVMLDSKRPSLKVQELYLFQKNSTFPSVAWIFILRNDNNSIIGDLMLQSTKDLSRINQVYYRRVLRSTLKLITW